MPKTTHRKTARPKGPAAPLSPEARLAYTQVASGLRGLGQSIAELQQTLRHAERRIEADARSRILALRREATIQLRALQTRQRELARVLRNLTAAAEGSWGEIKQAADVILAEARHTASAIIERVRLALRS
jgi:hypothetical protein